MNAVNAPSTSVTLRAACPEDLPRILQVLSEASLPVQGVPDGLTRVVVAEVAGELAGVAGLEEYGTSALLRSVAVARHHQGKGIAGALVRRLLQEATSDTIHDVYLRTTTAEDYFPRFGFSPVELSQVPLEVQDSVEFQGACPDSAVTMACRLRGRAAGAAGPPS